jgi:starch synthase
MMDRLRILYVASEINPFLQITKVADFVRKLPQVMQEKGMEIRILIPKFGTINERKNRLHEVVRLSGINISIGEDDKPLLIKVASIPNAKLQVYFIDNDDYFQRRCVLDDVDGNFCEDNDERAIFFCKGALETVKKLGWSPHIIHCHDWMTALIPLYLKTTYKQDPVFHHSKSIFTVFNNSFDCTFAEGIVEKAKMIDVDDEMLAPLELRNFEGFMRIGLEYADLILKAEDVYDRNIEVLLEEYATQKEIITVDDLNDFAEIYFNLYNEQVSVV